MLFHVENDGKKYKQFLVLPLATNQKQWNFLHIYLKYHNKDKITDNKNTVSENSTNQLKIIHSGHELTIETKICER